MKFEQATCAISRRKAGEPLGVLPSSPVLQRLPTFWKVAAPQPWSFMGDTEAEPPLPPPSTQDECSARVRHWPLQFWATELEDCVYSKTWVITLSQLIGTWPASVTHSLFWANMLVCLPGREWWLSVLFYPVWGAGKKMVITSGDRNWDSPGGSQDTNMRTEVDQGNFHGRFIQKRKNSLCLGAFPSRHV